VEDGNIFVDDGDGSDKPVPSDPPRTWWLLAVTIVGLVVAVVVVISTQRPTNELADNPPEASPVATTTTITQAITTTPTTMPTTTTIAVRRVIGDTTAFMVSDVRDFCVGASAFTNEGERPIAFGGSRILDADEWIESLGQDDWFLKHSDFLEVFLQEVSEAGMARDPHRRNLLPSVATYLVLADEALHDALQALDEGEPDPSWAYHISRIESSCAGANATMMAMLAMSAQ
jgi:hypothetical protein